MASRLKMILSSFLAVFMLAGTMAGTVAVTMTAFTEVAEAARVGGGRSFGSKSFMKRPAAQPSTAAKPQAGQQQPGAAAAAGATQRSGLFGGMGGMFGGLLAGSLIGSMLFGGGMGGMGGGFMDILIFGGLLYLLFKFIARRRSSAASAGAGARASGMGGMGDSNHAYQQTGQTGQAPGGMSWERLTGGNPDADEQPLQQSPTSANVPADFNQEEFLEGAKAAYVRLNAAWDKRNLSDIEQFATPSFMDEIRSQADADASPSTTEIMLVNASLVEVVRDGDDQMASVFFNVLMRESAEQNAPQDVREMWHFVRNADGTGMWRVDGIQQVN